MENRESGFHPLERWHGFLQLITYHGASFTTTMESIEFEFVRLEYEALRKEICQSIDKQHQIVLSAYGLIAALFGYAYVRPATALSTSQIQWTALAAVPFVFIAMSALWTVECNRMVKVPFISVTFCGGGFRSREPCPTMWDGKPGSGTINQWQHCSAAHRTRCSSVSYCGHRSLSACLRSYSFSGLFRVSEGLSLIS